jgi:hypothetical protein
MFELTRVVHPVKSNGGNKGSTRKFVKRSTIFFKLHSTTQTFTSHTQTHPYEHTHANPTPMSTSEGLSTGRSEDSRSHH